MAHVHYSEAAAAAARGIFAFHAFSFAIRCDTVLASMVAFVCMVDASVHGN